MRIRTRRLELIAAASASVQAALDGRAALAVALGARVPATWPPEFLDDAALEFTRAKLADPSQAGWWMYFLVLPGRDRVLIGSGGYAGPPAGGAVTVGYGIVSDHRRCGYASEAARGLIDHAFAHPEVTRVFAETLPELAGSIAVMRRCGMQPQGAGSEPGSVRYGLDRETHASLETV